MVNTQLSPEGPANSGWYVVNLSINNQTIGKADTKYPADKALRNPMSDKLLSTQRVVGVHGYTRLSNNELRSVGLVVAHIDIN
jgi:hypothetical protein